MAVPSKQHDGWTRLVSGKLEHEFSSVPAAMLMSRLRRDCAKDPKRIASLIDEAYGFFVKYETVLAGDITQIFGR